MDIDPILDAALALPEAERAEIAAALLASLGPAPGRTWDTSDRAWADELQRREGDEILSTLLIGRSTEVPPWRCDTTT